MNTYAEFASQNPPPGHITFMRSNIPNAGNNYLESVAWQDITGNVTNLAVNLGTTPGYFTLVFNNNDYGQASQCTSNINFFTSSAYMADGGSFDVLITCTIPDTIPPVPQSAATNTAGTTVTITFNESVASSDGSVYTSDFTVTANSTPVTINSIAFSGNNAILTLASPIYSGQTVKVAYDDTYQGLVDDAWNPAVAFSNFAVTNNSTASGNIAPTFVGATTTLTVNQNSGATDIKALLHVSDTDSSQTETWTQSVAPNHGGTLTFSGATASSGSADITPGGTITYQPANGYSGTETFTVQVSDGTASATRQITVTVAPVPTVTSVAVPTNGTYKIGDALNFTVSFDQIVTVTGSPSLSLTLNTGGTVQASYVSGSGSQNLVFRYTVASGNQDNDGITVGALALNSGTIRNATGGDATLTLNSVASTTGVLVDAVVPTVSSVTVPGNSTYIAGQNLDFTVNFPENVTVNTAGGTPYIPVTLDTGGTVSAAYVSGSGTSAIVFRYTIASGNLDTNGIVVGSAVTANGGTIRDAATNDATLTLNSVGSTASVLVDAVVPTVTSVTVPGNATYVAGQNLDFTVSFSENVNVTGTDSTLGLTIGSASVSAAQLSTTANSITYRYTVQNNDNDSDGITIGTITLNTTTIADAATNNANLTLNAVGSTAAVLVDALAPTVTSVTVPGNATYVAGQNLDFTVNISENVTVTGADSTLGLTIGVTARTAAQLSTTANSISYRYTIQSGDIDNDGITVGSITLNTTTIRDAAANNTNTTLNSVASTTGVLVDAVLPTISSVTVPGNATYVAGQNLDFTVNFTENVTVNTAG
ncbi:MAG: SwmB domain-containing protein, partial [Geobacteraceae bacterium]|nr:SwmB domain-containing protein [Geobacteraceae bacterium]